MRSNYILFALLSIFIFSCSGGRSLSRSLISGPSAGDNESGGGGGPAPDSGSDPGSGLSAVELNKLTTGYTLSTDHVHLASGESTSVTINFATPATQTAIIPYKVYGSHLGDFPQILTAARSEIIVAEGAMSASFNLQHPPSPSFSGRSNLILVLDDKSPSESRVVLSFHNDELRSMDQISLGNRHGCGIRSGQLYCWGYDPIGYGYLGLGVAQTRAASPVRVGNGSTWSQVDVGDRHSCAIDTGRLFCWGSDSSEQLGNGPGGGHQPTPIQVGAATNWSQVSVGYSNTCGIRAGELWCWGSDMDGLVGNGPGVSNADSPERVGGLANWTDISVGTTHVCGIESGNLYCWGRDAYGALGNGPGQSNVETPTAVGNTSWSQVSVGSLGTCALRLGELWCWGSDISGAIGNGEASTADVEAPERIGTSTTWSMVATSGVVSCGINAGALFCWGSNSFGGVGLGFEAGAKIHEPTQVGNLTNWSGIAISSHSACGVESGTYTCWGSNYSMKMGMGDGILENHTSASAFSQSAAWTEVSSSDDYACGILEGELYCWGDDKDGRLGNGAMKTADILFPERISDSKTWSTVSTGDDHVCGIDNGQLFCWGFASAGKLGNGQTSGNLESPQRIGTMTNWTHVSAAMRHTCGIESGNLYCWGSDSGENLGNGAGTLSSSVPMQIGVAGGWTALATGNNHSCGINRNRLYCWGTDTSGALGNGAGRSDAAEPEMIGLSTNWTQIATGNAHTCGIDNGALYCWGQDFAGQVGNGGGTTAIESPQQVGGSSQWSHIAAREDHTCGIDGGRLYCWGRNSFGQIGNGVVYNTNTEDAPYLVSAESDWVGLSVGNRSNFARRSGQTYMWGESLIHMVFQKPSF